MAEAEKRARIAERRLSDAGAALEAVAVLVRELRAVLDELRSQRRAPPEPGAEPATPVELDERKTIEAPPPSRVPGRRRVPQALGSLGSTPDESTTSAHTPPHGADPDDGPICFFA